MKTLCAAEGLSCKEVFSLRTLSLFLSVLLVLSVVFAPASAITWDDVTESFACPVDQSFLLWHWLTNSDFLTWFDHSESDPGSLMFYFIYSPLNCKDNPNKFSSNGDYAPHDFGSNPVGIIEGFEGDYSCIYCGITFDQYREAVAAERELWESDLPPGLEAGTDGVTIFGNGFRFDTSDNTRSNEYLKSLDLYTLFADADKNDTLLYAHIDITSTREYYFGLYMHDPDVGSLGWIYPNSIYPYTSEDYPIGQLVYHTGSSSAGQIYNNFENCKQQIFSSGQAGLYFLTPDSYLSLNSNEIISGRVTVNE